RSRPFDAAERAHRARLDAEMHDLRQHRSALQARAASVQSPRLTRIDAELRDARKRLAALPALSADPSPTNGYPSGIMPSADAVKWVQVDLAKSVHVDEIRLIPARPTDFADTPGFGFPVRFRVEASDDADFHTSHTLADHTVADYPNPGDEV